MSYVTTVIVADSRGKGFEDFVGSHPTPVNNLYDFHIHPGKTLSQLAPLITNTISSYGTKPVYCVVFAGICGFTDKMRENNILILRYHHSYRQNKVETNIDTAKHLKTNFGDRINICSIIPASLIVNFKIQNPGLDIPDYLFTEQRALEEDITTVNKVLLDLNSSPVTNINLSNRVILKSKKKRQRSGSKVVYRRVEKYSYQHLPDGVHFDDKLKTTVFSLIVDTSIRDLLTKEAQQAVDSHRLQTRPVGGPGRLCITLENIKCALDSDANKVSD